MRVIACLVAVWMLAQVTSAGAQSRGQRVAFVHGHVLVVLDLRTLAQRVVLRDAGLGPVAWSGDGRLLSDGGRVVGGPRLPTTAIAWAPTGETAAYITSGGTVELWSPAGGRRVVVRAAWGARSVAWGRDGELALGRKLPTPRGPPFAHEEVWVWRAGGLRRVAGPLHVDTYPIVEGFDARGRVLWWSDLWDSGSVRADGLPLYADTTLIAKSTLVFPDFVAQCDGHLVLAVGGDRYTTKGKSIVEDGRDISNDTSRSWVSPSCGGGTVVAAAGRNGWENRFGLEHRSIWQLEPTREKLTDPPASWTDEYPRVLADGSVLFVRTRETGYNGPQGWGTNLRASLDRLADGAVQPLASLSLRIPETAVQSFDPNFYGHYGWPEIVAVSP